MMASIQDSQKIHGGSDSNPTQVSPPPPGLSDLDKDDIIYGQHKGDDLTDKTESQDSNLDDNYIVYKQHEGDAPADTAESKRVLRKVDWRVLPVLWTLYLIQYLDKNGLNYVSSSRLCTIACPEACSVRRLEFWMLEIRR